MSDYFSADNVLPGSAAKVKVQQELIRLFSGNRKHLNVLDIGCVGPSPLEFWVPLMRLRFKNIRLTGIDVNGIEKAQSVVRKMRWKNVKIRQCSSYTMEECFGKNAFDVVVSTQVLEHIFRPRLYMENIAAILKPGGEAFLTLDSAHKNPRFSLTRPVRSIKNFAKLVLAFFGHERHYDLPLYDTDVRRYAHTAGLKIEKLGYYNLTPLKYLHNRVVHDQNIFLKNWIELEETVNRSGTLPSAVKKLFLGIYCRLRKPE
jgi:2-polyprenyl-3-methyl-5-hydroxy-6-metoxy-1,4-benzoquinol methylase